MLKLGLDIHGVINTHTQLVIKEVIPTARSMGAEIHIITGSSRDTKMLNELLSYNNGYIWWDHFFSVSDYLDEKDLLYHIDKHGRKWWDDDGVWDRAKGDYCFKNNITLHIDDTPRYKEYFRTPFILIDDFLKMYEEGELLNERSIYS